MIYYLIVGVAGALLAFSLISFRKIFFELVERTTSLLNIILDSTLSDNDKQTALVSRLGKLLVSLFKTLLTLAFTALVTIAPIFIYSKIQSTELIQLDLSSFYFYLALSIGSIVPFVVLNKISPSEDYSDWSKLLHRIILDNYNISRALFFMGKKMFLKSSVSNSQFLIVTGLARAGTTALTTILHNSSRLYSLSYANMPFLLSPNLWGKIYQPPSKTLKERSHGDKVLFGYNTVEALEEYFWKVFTNDQFISDSSLLKHKVDEQTFQNYLCYQQLIRKQAREGSTYLAKNNNFILRYQSLRGLSQDFMVIILFRDPISHANSLFIQHQRYRELQDADDFVREYMNWLGHHEFGNDHKYFELGFNGFDQFQLDSINYWICNWINYYEYILSLPEDDKVVLLDYQDFLTNPNQTIQAIEGKLEMTFNLGAIKNFQNPPKTPPEVDPSLQTHAQEIYHQLKQQKINVSP